MPDEASILSFIARFGRGLYTDEVVKKGSTDRMGQRFYSTGARRMHFIPRREAAFSKGFRGSGCVPVRLRGFMKGYVLKRIMQSILSVFIVSTLTVFLVYSCVPRQLVFKGDLVLPKLANKPDEYHDYKFRTWENLGYLDYITQKEYAQSVFGNDSPQVSDSLLVGSTFYGKFRADFSSKGYAVEVQPVTGYLYATKDIPLMSRVLRWYRDLIQIDNINAIQDPGNPSLKRGYYFTKDWSGRTALAASGTKYKYQLWVDGSFPFLHQNVIKLNMGRSYPTFDGLPVLEVIAGGQGRSTRREITATVRGEQVTFYTSLDEHSLKYKPLLDRLDTNKFEDNYANGAVMTEDPSMMGISFKIGMYSLIISLSLGLTIGVIAAMKKDKLFDKVTMGYIVFISSIPTLLYIALFARFGMKGSGCPTSSPSWGRVVFSPISFRPYRSPWAGSPARRSGSGGTWSTR